MMVGGHIASHVYVQVSPSIDAGVAALNVTAMHVDLTWPESPKV